MGGGDLNLKKSWHPQTLQNIEKVWKAEQKAEAESKKIEQLRRELDEERQREEMQRYAIDQGIAKKKSDRLEWMYAAPGHSGINHEEYLLGKSIDKAVDPLAQNDDMNTDAPGASFMDTDSPNASNDLAAKIRDDPLFMIKKKENEKKKELLKNPVRMKQLQEMLKADLGRKGKKNKKDKKKKKRKNSTSDEEVSKHRSKSSSKRTKENFQPYSGNEQRLNGTSRHHERNEKSERNGHYSRKNNNGKYESHDRSVERQERYERQTGRKYDPIDDEKREYLDKRRGASTERRTSYKTADKSLRNRSCSPERKRYKQSRNEESHARIERRRKSRSSSPKYHRNSGSYVEGKSGKSRQKDNNQSSRKLTDEERERRLAEMMDNAKWRDEQRGINVKRYKEEDEAEARRIDENTGKGASFVQPLKVGTFTSSTASVENRIKRNINSLQRTPAAMEKFLKK